MEPVDFEAIRQELSDIQQDEVTEQDIISYVLYPKVYKQYIQTKEQFGNVSLLDTPTFLFGMRNGETVEIEIDTGKRLIIKLETISEPDENGKRTIYYAMNGQKQDVSIFKMKMLKRMLMLNLRRINQIQIILVLKCWFCN